MQSRVVNPLFPQTKRFQFNTMEEFLESKVFYSPDGCWYWTGNQKQYGGYGVCRALGETCAHRVSYIVFVGEIPKGMQVCHLCDNPICIRPDHLFLGSHLDNMRDKLRKGRAKIGYHSRLTADKALEIRKLRERGMTTFELCQKFSVTKETITDVLKNRTWKSQTPTE